MTVASAVPPEATSTNSPAETCQSDAIGTSKGLVEGDQPSLQQNDFRTRESNVNRKEGRQNLSESMSREDRVCWSAASLAIRRFDLLYKNSMSCAEEEQSNMVMAMGYVYVCVCDLPCGPFLFRLRANAYPFEGQWLVRHTSSISRRRCWAVSTLWWAARGPQACA